MYHGKSPCKGVFFITKNGLFVHLRSQSLFYFFNFFLFRLFFFTISKKRTTRFWKVFFKKNFFQFFQFFHFYFFMIVLRNKSKKWLFFCHATYIMFFSLWKNDFLFLWFFFLFLCDFYFIFINIICINIYAL